MHWTRVWLVVSWLGLGVGAGAADAPDQALEGAVTDPFASGGRSGVVSASLADGRLRVAWAADGRSGADNEAPRVIASTDALGHWAVRDWRSWPMVWAEGRWQVSLPLLSTSVPVVYFVEQIVSGSTNQSAMRCFRPKLAGISEPTLAFRGFLEGFEQGLVGWEWGGSGDAGPWMTVSSQAWAGKGALRLAVPSGRGSATVGTVRLRGWMLEEHLPRAIRMMTRMESGEGRLRLALHGNARTEGLAVYPAQTDIPVTTEWRRVEVPLKDFVHLRPATVDWMTLQLLADSERAVLVDEVELVLR